MNFGYKAYIIKTSQSNVESNGDCFFATLREAFKTWVYL